jgi:hypothetical protein
MDGGLASGPVQEPEKRSSTSERIFGPIGILMLRAGGGASSSAKKMRCNMYDP